MITEFDSIFHENGFIFVNERSSYNRNGNREGIGATNVGEYKLKKGVYKDPRNKMQGASSLARSHGQNDKRVDNTMYSFDIHKADARRKNNKVIERNLDGSEKHVNATRSNKSWDKARAKYK